MDRDRGADDLYSEDERILLEEHEEAPRGLPESADETRLRARLASAGVRLSELKQLGHSNSGDPSWGRIEEHPCTYMLKDKESSSTTLSIKGSLWITRDYIFFTPVMNSDTSTHQPWSSSLNRSASKHSRRISFIPSNTTAATTGIPFQSGSDSETLHVESLPRKSASMSRRFSLKVPPQPLSSKATSSGTHQVLPNLPSNQAVAIPIRSITSLMRTRMTAMTVAPNALVIETRNTSDSVFASHTDKHLFTAFESAANSTRTKTLAALEKTISDACDAYRERNMRELQESGALPLGKSRKGWGGRDAEPGFHNVRRRSFGTINLFQSLIMGSGASKADADEAGDADEEAEADISKEKKYNRKLGKNSVDGKRVSLKPSVGADRGFQDSGYVTEDGPKLPRPLTQTKLKGLSSDPKVSYGTSSVERKYLAKKISKESLESKHSHISGNKASGQDSEILYTDLSSPTSSSTSLSTLTAPAANAIRRPRSFSSPPKRIVTPTVEFQHPPPLPNSTAAVSTASPLIRSVTVTGNVGRQKSAMQLSVSDALADAVARKRSRPALSIARPRAPTQSVRPNTAPMYSDQAQLSPLALEQIASMRSLRIDFSRLLDVIIVSFGFLVFGVVLLDLWLILCIMF
ncbi:hypothetical protein BJ741DRAFT_609305 [Chytriomyces cf. hyalinus JEL632]|nr:hypothetical protein BJ741DRAFT_609305 [Chytriomyces cf. hyalinus JEL632]